MDSYRFYHPVEVRYGDLDPQGHLNNARYLTYMEQARIYYLKQLGVWDGKSFLDIGIILADIHITFHSAVQFGRLVRVGAKVTRLGNKSLDMIYRLEDSDTGQEFATSSSVLVAFDYRAGKTVVIPDSWRQAIGKFEHLEAESG
jgi:acyl-CoA thioester hydrolase